MQATYQLVDAVDGPVVLVTEPLHAFEAEKGKRKVLVTAKLRTGHQEGNACGHVMQGQTELAPTQRSQGTKESRSTPHGQPGWAEYLGLRQSRLRGRIMCSQVKPDVNSVLTRA